MKANKKLNFLHAVAELAISNGLDISVELKDKNSDSKALNGVLVTSNSNDGSIILRAYKSDYEQKEDDCE